MGEGYAAIQVHLIFKTDHGKFSIHYNLLLKNTYSGEIKKSLSLTYISLIHNNFLGRYAKK